MIKSLIDIGACKPLVSAIWALTVGSHSMIMRALEDLLRSDHLDGKRIEFRLLQQGFNLGLEAGSSPLKQGGWQQRVTGV